MLRSCTALALVLALALAPPASASASPSTSPIKRVVVLMMENHSFDNMLGWHPSVGQLKPDMFNLVDPANASSTRVHVSRGAHWCTTPDPIHIVPDVGDQVCAPGPAFGERYAPTMGGFVANFLGRAKAEDPGPVMAAYTPDQVPVISQLASSFKTFTRWHSAIAGSTGVNRLMAHAGTTGGYTGAGYEAPFISLEATSLIDTLLDEGFTAKVEYVDFCTAHAIHPLASKHPHVFSRSDGLRAFFDSVANHELANFTWLVPQLFPGIDAYPTSQHPVGDVRAGEALIKQVYDALVASPYWNETLLLITYDEHGGFFDHVPPPGPGVGSGPVPDPDPTTTPSPFTYDFTRLGVRVPTIAISPWLDPTPESDTYWGTSLPATVRKLFGLTSPPLSARSAAAPTFESVFRTSLRDPSSYPDSLPDPPDPHVPYCHILPDEPPNAPEFLSMYQSLLDDAALSLPVRAEDISTAHQAHAWIIAAGDALVEHWSALAHPSAA